MKKVTERTQDALGLITLNLQTFSDDGTEPTTADPAPEPEVYTKEQVEKMLQAESDRRVQQALKTNEEKLRADFQTKLEKERKEAERLAQLTAEEKAKEAEVQRQKEIEEREKTIRKRELLMDTIDLLQEKSLPRSFAEMLMAEDAETTQARVSAFQKQYQQDIEKAVSDRLKSGHTPAKGSETDPVVQLENQLKSAKSLDEKLMLKRKIEELKKGD